MIQRRDLLATLVAFFFSACTHYDIIGGRDHVNIAPKPSEFAEQVMPVVSDSDEAIAKVQAIAQKTKQAEVFSTLGWVSWAIGVGVGGYGLESDSSSVSWGGTACMAVSAVFFAIKAYVSPEDDDYAAVLRAYNKSVPEYPLKSTELKVFPRALARKATLQPPSKPRAVVKDDEEAPSPPAERSGKAANKQSEPAKGVKPPAAKLPTKPATPDAAATSAKGKRLSDDECFESDFCSKYGRCASDGNRCIAANDVGCKQSLVCQTKGKCRTVDGECVK